MTVMETHTDAVITQADTSPLAILQRAVESNVDVDTLERLMALSERHRETQSRERFRDALAEFQRKCPPIHKSRKADRFTYAGFDDVMKVVQPILSGVGLSIGFDTKHDDNGMFTVTCRIGLGGYHEDRTFSVPVPASLKVSEPQKYGAAMSYAKRYCLCGALNIVVTDEDDELNLRETISETDMAHLNTLIEDTHSDFNRFLAAYNIESLEQMTHKDYLDAVRKLESKKNKQNGGSK